MGNQSPLKHGGNTPIQFDYSKFQRRSLNQIISEPELASHLRELEKKENQLSKYKHHEDFDRISTEFNKQVPTLEQAHENTIKMSLVIGFFVTALYTSNIYHSQSDFCLYKRYYLPLSLTVMSIGSIYLYFSQFNHPSHNLFHRQSKPEEKAYRALDETMNLYHYVDDIKYRFDYSKSQMRKTRKEHHEGLLAHAEKHIQANSALLARQLD